MEYTLDFEKPVQDLENQIKDLKDANDKSDLDISKEISKIRSQTNQKYDKITLEGAGEIGEIQGNGRKQ